MSATEPATRNPSPRNPAASARRQAEFADALDRPAVRLLYEDDTLRIRLLPGQGARAVLAFTGRQQALGGMTPDEFAGSAADGLVKDGPESGGLTNHVLFISDLVSSYFTSAGQLQRIAEVVRGFTGAEGISDLSAVGNSMGGTGAILAAAQLPIRHVAAFNPAIRFTADLLADPFWDGFRERLGPDLIPDLGALMQSASARFWLTFGGRRADDRSQCAAVPQAGHIRTHMIAGLGHDLPRWLKDRGLIRPIVRAKLSGDAAELNRLYRLVAAAAGDPLPSTEEVR